MATEVDLDKPKDNSATRFKPGNTEWMRRHNPGRPKIYSTADELWTACLEYIDWVMANPRPGQHIFSFQGETHTGTVDMPRAMIQQELCRFLGITVKTWGEYGKKTDLSHITDAVNDIMFTENFQWAAIGVLKENLIARKLGLKDARELSGPDGGPVEINYAESARARLRGKLIPEAGSS